MQDTLPCKIVGGTSRKLKRHLPYLSIGNMARASTLDKRIRQGAITSRGIQAARLIRITARERIRPGPLPQSILPLAAHGLAGMHRRLARRRRQGALIDWI